MNISQNRTLAIYTRITCAQIPGLPVHGFLLHNYWNMYAALSPSLHATLRISMVEENCESTEGVVQQKGGWTV